MEFEIQKIVAKISTRNKRLFVEVLIVTLLVHVFKLVNYLPNHDSLYYFYGSQDSITSGRWALKYAAGISSYFDIPWLTGVLSAIYISLSAVLIVNLIKINNVFLEFLAALCIGIYPSVTSTFAYAYAADAYFLAMLLATFSVAMFLENDWKKRLLGSLSLGFATGIYQAYLAFAVVLIIICLVKYSLWDNMNIFRMTIRCLYSGVIGVLVYAIGLNIRLDGRQLLEYQGISDASLLKPLDEYFAVVKECWPELLRLMFKDNMYGNEVVAGLVMFFWSGALALFLVKCVKEIKRKRYVNVICSVVFFALLPIAVYCVKFLSENVVYHKLMVQSVAVIWLIPIIVLDNIEFKKPIISKVCAEILLILLLINYGNWIIGNNICYVSMHKAYEKGYALALRIADRIEQIPDFETTDFLYVAGTEYMRIGETADSNLYLDSDLYRVTQSMTGISASIIQYANPLYVFMINEYIGGDYETLYTQDEISAIKDSVKYKEMPTWPREGSVGIINNVIVVKMADVEGEEK